MIAESVIMLAAVFSCFGLAVSFELWTFRRLSLEARLFRRVMQLRAQGRHDLAGELEAALKDER